MQRYELSTVFYSLLTLSLLTSVFLAGCASTSQVSIEEQLSSKSLQWADALMELDYDKALTYMTPSYRSSPRAERFRADFSGVGYWQDAEIKWVKCDEDISAAEVPFDGSSMPPADTETSGDPTASEHVNGCEVTVWNDCGNSFPGPVSNSTTTVTLSKRCEVRVILTVLKPPEMSYPMPIPYELTWLNVDGKWYIYR